MSRAGALLLGMVVLAGAVIVAPAVLMLMAFTSGKSELAGQDCQPEVTNAQGSAGDVESLDARQLANAQTIVATGSRMRVPPRGIVIALAVAHQESGFRNYANDGRGDDLQPGQTGIARSLALPHEAVGTDHGSLGVFQQQWPWWGSMRELMTPAVASQKFYRRLLQVPGWQEMPLTRASQAVQRSAFPQAYADDEAIAVELLQRADLLGGEVVDAAYAGAGSSVCLAPASYEGGVVAPIHASLRYSDLRNFGGAGPHWSRGHTGTDFSATCGTPVVAAHSGTVEIETDQGWSGKWLVKVSAGPGRLTTWYAHMQAVHVTRGQTVRAGQPLGEVGTLGNSTGCHLHFEVHPHGGSIYQDSVDPSEWLEQSLGSDIELVAAEATQARDYLLASFNVLGHSHTKPGGPRKGWASSRQRMRWAVELFDGYSIAVAGLQEFQAPQKRAFLELAGDRYAVYSPGGDPRNSIIWHRGRFSLVDADTFKIPYFDGHLWDLPIVRLRDRLTGQESMFINVHNPADTRRHPNQKRWRDDAVRRELAVVRSLAARYDLPMFITGDFNDRRAAFCPMTSSGLLTASAGGSDGGRCRPPRRAGIDWIFGPGAAWAGHWAVRESVQGRVSDHPLVLARIRGGSGDE